MIHGPNIPGSYTILFLAASDLIFITSQFSHSVVTDSLWPHGLGSRLFVTPWPGFPITNFWSLLKLMSIKSVMPSNISSCLQSFPASGSFLMSWLFTSSGQSIGVSALASVLPMNIQDWFPLRWTGLISLQSKGLKSLLQHHRPKASVLQFSIFFIA